MAIMLAYGRRCRRCTSTWPILGLSKHLMQRRRLRITACLLLSRVTMRGASVRRDSVSARSRRQTARVCLLLAGVAAAAGLLGYVLGADAAPWRKHTKATTVIIVCRLPHRRCKFEHMHDVTSGQHRSDNYNTAGLKRQCETRALHEVLVWWQPR